MSQETSPNFDAQAPGNRSASRSPSPAPQPERMPTADNAPQGRRPRGRRMEQQHQFELPLNDVTGPLTNTVGQAGQQAGQLAGQTVGQVGQQAGQLAGQTAGQVGQQAGQLAGQTAGQAAPAGGRTQRDTLKLRLDLNLDVDVQIKARIHGDVTLSLLD